MSSTTMSALVHDEMAQATESEFFRSAKDCLDPGLNESTTVGKEGPNI